MAKSKEVTQETEAVEVVSTEKELTFVLKLNQANIILSALDEIPHKLSRTIIDELQRQAYPQMQESAE